MSEKAISGPGEIDIDGGTTVCRRCGVSFADEAVQWFPITVESCVGICTPCVTRIVRTYLSDEVSADAIEEAITESGDEEPPTD